MATIYIRLLFILHCSPLILNFGPVRSFDKSKRAKRGLDDATYRFASTACIQHWLAAVLRTTSFTSFLICALDRIYRRSSLERMLIPIQEIMRILIKIENARSTLFVSGIASPDTLTWIVRSASWVRHAMGSELELGALLLLTQAGSDDQLKRNVAPVVVAPLHAEPIVVAVRGRHRYQLTSTKEEYWYCKKKEGEPDSEGPGEMSPTTSPPICKKLLPSLLSLSVGPIEIWERNPGSIVP